MSARPTVAEIRTAIGVPATAVSDEDLQRIYDAECASQATRCHVGDDPTTDTPDPLAQALVRRVQREVAARNLPLGMVGIDSEYGAQRLPGTDALIDDLERPYRVQVLG
jgi:hypothetical protein